MSDLRRLVATAHQFASAGEFESAAELMSRAIALSDQKHVLEFLLGQIWYQGRHHVQSMEAFERALAHASDFFPAAGGLLGAQRNLCDFIGAARTEIAISQAVKAGRTVDIAPTSAFEISSLTPSELMVINRRFAERNVGALPPPLRPRHRPPADLGRPVKVGYLSDDFHDHATMFLLRGVIERHDKRRVRTYCYSIGPSIEDESRQRVVAASEVFRDLSSADDVQVAQCIAADQVDILIDIKGPLLGRQRITAMRPAPIIVNWLGFPGTFGLPVMADYILADQIVIPASHASAFSEKVVYLPGSYQPNDRSRKLGPVPPRASLGLPDDGVVLCNFNQSYKITGAWFALWMDILRQTSGSVLWLLEPEAIQARANLLAAARCEGVDSRRIVFAQRVPQAQHLTRLQAADLAIDTFPVTSHTTASDALWAGVPLLTRIGETFVTRVAASVNCAAGLSDLVVDSERAFVQQAIQLIQSPGALRDLRARIDEAKASAPLFDADHFASSLDAVLGAIWSEELLGL